MSGGAFLITLELAVTLPYGSAVLVIAVPNLRTVNITAVTTDDFTGKRTLTKGTSAAVFSSGKFKLNTLPFFRLYDSRVAP